MNDISAKCDVVRSVAGAEHGDAQYDSPATQRPRIAEMPWLRIDRGPRPLLPTGQPGCGGLPEIGA